jgi:predicted lactoylglutathione lyase
LSGRRSAGIEETPSLIGFLARGGRITKEPVDAALFEERSSYFADPENNYWEVVYFGGRGEAGEAIRHIIE